MNTTTYTPGPWAYNYDDRIVYDVPTDGDSLYIKVSDLGDAHLIAAAPAMYEALVETMRVLRSLRDNKEEWYTLVTPELLTAWDKNKAVLAQAEGRTL